MNTGVIMLQLFSFQRKFNIAFIVSDVAAKNQIFCFKDGLLVNGDFQRGIFSHRTITHPNRFFCITNAFCGAFYTL